MTFVTYAILFLVMALSGFMIEKIVHKFNPLVCLLIIAGITATGVGIMFLGFKLGFVIAYGYTPLVAMAITFTGWVSGLLVRYWRSS